ncbi:MAG: DHH family phosphoesterase [bacterium]
MEIKNLKKAAERIVKAVKNKEKIIIYGDTDLDGTSSVIILEETIKNLGGRASIIYFPDRETEGYGVSETALKFLKGEAPALLIALDCGISNFKEMVLAKKLGFKTIIVDHHQVLDKLPKAEIIVDPKQKGDKYPFKNLAAVGITFKLSEAVLKEKMTESLRNNFLELTALATIADMVPQEEENRILTEEGLSSLKDSWRPGLKAFLEEEAFKDCLNFNQKVSKIISILNVRDVENRLPASFRLLTASSSAEAEKMIKKFLIKQETRRQNIEKMVEIIEERLIMKREPLIFEGDSSFDFTLMSSAASILCQRYKKPVFVFKKMEKESQGTVRSPSGIDSVALMKKCSKYPLTFGGHAPASGFRIKNEDLEKFKMCLIKNLTGQRR